MPAKREQALVHPPSGGKMRFKQSRFEHLASVPFRVIAAGRSGSGRTSALYSAVTDHYRGCFKEVRIIARTAHLDHSYVQLREWAADGAEEDRTAAQQRRFACFMIHSNPEILRHPKRIFIHI